MPTHSKHFCGCYLTYFRSLRRFLFRKNKIGDVNFPSRWSLSFFALQVPLVIDWDV